MITTIETAPAGGALTVHFLCIVSFCLHNTDVANVTVPTSQRRKPKQRDYVVNMPRVTQLVAGIPEPLISVTAA